MTTRLDPARIAALRCYLMPGRFQMISEKNREYYEASYQLWRQMIQEGFHSEGQAEAALALTSDEFVRQDRVIALFDSHQPVGLVVMDSLNLHSSACCDHSYFKHYPFDLVEYLKDQNHFNVMSMSQLVVPQDWRKRKVGIGISEILIGLAMKEFLTSSSSAIVTFTRNDRGTHSIVYRFGGKAIVRGFESYHVASDAILISRDAVVSSEDIFIREAIDHLWNNKLVLDDESRRSS